MNVYDYLADVKTELENYRPTEEVKFVFDVLNFHNYRFSDFGLPRSYGLAPEESDGTANPDLYAKLDALNAHIASLGLSDKDVWLSEFGYDTNPFSDGVALPEYTVTLSKSSLDIIEDVAVSATGSCDVQETNVVELGVTELDLRRTENFQDFYVNNSDGNDNVITANDNSSRILVLRKYWDEIHPEDQKKILDVIYETQARWLVRGFMEVRRADWDKVIQFCIRDEQPFDGRLFKRNSNNEVTCIEEYDPGSYRFKNSGLLEGKESGFSPKTSYYYTRTLKKTFSGTTTIEDLSIAGDTKRVYRFTGGGKTVYAVWLPTEGFNIEEEMTIAQFQQYAPGISQSSTLIELEAPYEGGKWSELGENIVVSDKPIFILAKNYDQDYPSSLCESGIDVEYQTCKHVRLSLDNSVGSGQEWDRYQVYYAPFGTVSDPDNPRLDEITLYDDEIDGSLSEIVVTDFQDEEYDFCEYWNIYVRGVIDNEDEYYLSDWCRKSVKSKNCICTVDVDLDNISGDECNGGGFDDAKSLFEYDNLDLCDLDSPANITELNNEPFWSFNDCNNVQQLRVPFTSAQKIDAVYLYDHTGNNLLTVQGRDTGGNLHDLIEYDTRGDGVWKSFANFVYDSGVQPEFEAIILTALNNEVRLKKVIVLCHSGTNTPGDEQLVEPNTPTGSESPTVFEEQNKIETVDIIDLPNGDKNFGWENPLYAESAPLNQDSIRYLVSLSNEYNEETEELINPRQIEINRPKSEEYSELVVSREIEGVDFRKDVRVVVKYECYCKIRTSDDVPVEGYAVNDSDENPQLREFLKKQNSTEEIYIYPVPAAAELKIEINIEGVQSLDIFDINGKYITNAPTFSGVGRSIVDISAFPSGIYLLHAKKADGTIILKRFVKME